MKKPRIYYAMMLILCICFSVSCSKENLKDEITNVELVSTLDQNFSDFKIVKVETSGMFAEIQKLEFGESTTITLPNGTDEPWILQMTRNDVVGKNFVAQEIAKGEVKNHDLSIITLQGMLSGNPANTVRLTISAEFVSGTIVDNGETYLIEPLQLYDRGATQGQCVVYNDRDVIATAIGSCGVVEPKMSPDERRSAIPGNDEAGSGMTEAAANCKKLELICHADYEYFRYRAGSDFNLATFAIAVTINNTSAKFNPLMLDFELLSILVFTDLGNPLYYPTSGNIYTMFDQTRDFFNFFRPNEARDAVILFTGKQTGNVIGLASLGVICKYNRTESYAVVMWQNTTPYTTNVTAHEVGHLLSARHPDNDPLSQNSCPGYYGGNNDLMMSTARTTSQAAFANCGIHQMSVHMFWNPGCLSLGPCN